MHDAEGAGISGIVSLKSPHLVSPAGAGVAGGPEQRGRLDLFPAEKTLSHHTDVR